MLLSGAATLANLTGDTAPVTRAIAIAQAAIAYFAPPSPSNPLGALLEVSCGGNGTCNGMDGQQFKGVFVRHLAYALPAMAAVDPAAAGPLSQWLLSQAASITSRSAVVSPTLNATAYGQLWQGPFSSSDWMFQPVAQGAALDAIVAAMGLL